MGITKSGYYPKKVQSVTQKDYNWKTNPNLHQDNSPSEMYAYKKPNVAPGTFRTTYGEEFFKKKSKTQRPVRNAWEKPSKKFGNPTEY